MDHIQLEHHLWNRDKQFVKRLSKVQQRTQDNSFYNQWHKHQAKVKEIIQSRDRIHRGRLHKIEACRHHCLDF